MPKPNEPTTPEDQNDEPLRTVNVPLLPSLSRTVATDTNSKSCSARRDAKHCVGRMNRQIRIHFQGRHNTRPRLREGPFRSAVQDCRSHVVTEAVNHCWHGSSQLEQQSDPEELISTSGHHACDETTHNDLSHTLSESVQAVPTHLKDVASVTTLLRRVESLVGAKSFLLCLQLGSSVR